MPSQPRLPSPLWFLPPFLVLALAWPATARDFYVSPDGSDRNPGTREQPWATLAKAGAMAEAGDTCYLREGTYRETLRVQRSGAPGRPIVFTNYPGEEAVLSGADVLAGWQAERGGIYAAPMPWSLDDGNQVLLDGKMLGEARWPNAGEQFLFQPRRAQVEQGSPTTITCRQIPGSDGAWEGAHVWCAGGAAWICWSAPVTAYDAGTHTLTFDGEKQGHWYTARQGNLFALMGIPFALDAPGEWLYDDAKKQLRLIPPVGVDPANMTVEAKRRQDVVDLRGRSHIRLAGLSFRAGGICTDERCSHILLERLKGRYVAHSYLKDQSNVAGVLIGGSDNLVLSCDLGYSSASVLSVSGKDNRVINCLIHHGGYAGLWKGTVRLQGRRIVFSHNTVRHAGRDLVNTHGLMESLVAYNDLSDAGWLTKDLGMTYGHNTDFANTVFHHNLVHDNHAAHCAMGIYFDHLSHNAIVHHNVIWNVGMDPLRFNNPSYCNLVFNNTCWNTGTVGTFDHSRRNDLFASRYVANIFNRPPRLPDHVTLEHNLVLKQPPLRDPGGGDFRLEGSAQGSRFEKQNLGAYAPHGRLWRAGCDLANPPNPLPVYQPPTFPWMNLVKNACFEFGSLESWKKTHGGQATLTDGNGWGNSFSRDKAHATGTSKYELRLGPARDGVTQTIGGLAPNTPYTLSAWVRVSSAEESISFGVRGHGRPERSVASSSTAWQRRSLRFTTGPESREAVIYLSKVSDGPGNAWADNLTLPATPPKTK